LTILLLSLARNEAERAEESLNKNGCDDKIRELGVAAKPAPFST
jgi:hypothetical protein